MELRDVALMAAGILGAGVAVIHGVLTQRFIVEPIRRLGAERLAPQIVRLAAMLLQFSTFAWLLGGLALAATPWMGAGARTATAVLVGVAYLFAVVGNAWATRGRHPGWMLYAVAVALIAYGLWAPAP